jgi:type IV pilus assembly protein PilN
MIRINLLPHREIKRAQRQRQFFVFAALGASLALAIVLGVHGVISGLNDRQMARNHYLEAEIAKLDKQIEEIKRLKEQTQALLARKQVVESLQANRNQAVQLLDQLVRQLPEGVYLKSVKQSGEKVNITGYAQSNARVSTLMRNLESSPWLEAPNLIEIKSVETKTFNQPATRLSEFTLSVALTRSQSASDHKPSSHSQTGKKT